MNSYHQTVPAGYTGFYKKNQKSACFSFSVKRTCLFLISLVAATCLHAQDVNDLKKLSLEELMSLEVTSVSRRPEKLTETASAIQVITSDAITDYGATNIPEALYLAGNLQVAQSGAHRWNISARGFNTELANKLLVLMDGRTLYTPLFSGVFWDRQNYLLEDISRIEVISGPGGTLWGANAVNGVINITTKSAEETQGLYADGAIGTELRAQTALRYGGKLAPNVYYRLYGQYNSRDEAVFPDSTKAHDASKMAQGGFRVDAKHTPRSTFTLQGDLYNLREEMNEGGRSEVTGGNILGRWEYAFADSSTIRVHSYYDRTKLSQPAEPLVIDGNELAPEGTFKDDLTTFDIELQHRFRLGSYNQFVWGGGYRFTHDQATNAPSLGFLPEELKQELFSVFLQDEIQVVKNLFLILGTKLEHNDYTGFVLEPNTRLRWNIADNQIIWAAVSRAVRTPSRIDRDLTTGTPPYFVLLKGSSDFQPETVIAFESGFRTSLGAKASTAISLFYNQYDDIRSAALHPETIFPISFRNGLEGETYGLEFSLTYQVADWWRLFTSYNLLREDIRVREGETDINNGFNETADPGWQFSLRSSYTLPHGIGVHPAFRWIDNLLIDDEGEQKVVPSYAELDIRISWQPVDLIELSVAGRNLLHKHHVEYGIPGPLQEAIERSVYGKVAVRF